MAVPGRIDQASSRGCHQLIREGAVMVTSVDDILEELRYVRMEVEAHELEETSAPLLPDLSAMEQAALSHFAGGEIMSLDGLAETLEQPVAELSAILMELELKGQIIKRADGRFEMK